MKKADPFQVEPLPKAFYYPSKEKELSKKEKKVCLSVPVSSQQEVTSPEDIKFLKDTNAIKEIPTRENGSYADQSSSSQFNESWPSTEQAGSMGTEPLSEGTVSSPEMSQQMREWLTAQDRPATNSTLGWFINRFRSAPPSSRQQRDKKSFTNEKQADFWWLSPPSGQSTPMLDTPPQKLNPSPNKGSLQKKNKGPISTSSPVYQSDNTTEELNRRAKELLERSETSMETSSTEPFPLPLKKPASAKQKTSESKPRQSSTPSPSTKPTRQTTNILPTPSLQHRNPWPEDDILYQWRLGRKMEKAQERANTIMGPKGVPSLGVRTASGAYGLGRTRGEFGVRDGVTGLYLPQDHPILHSRPSETLPSEHLTPFTATPALEATTAVAISTSTNVSQTVALPDASPVAMVTTTMTTPITTPTISHPCRHLERTTMDSRANVTPHMHLACDILPCPCTETVSKKKGDLPTSQQNEKRCPGTRTLKLNQDSDVYSEEEKENEIPKEKKKKSAEIQGIRDPDLLEESKTSVRTNKRHSGTNGLTNEKEKGRKEKVHQKRRNGNKRNRSSDMVENIIGKVVSEHLFSGDTSSDGDNSCRTSIESQSHHSRDVNEHTMASSTHPEEDLLAESSEEEFVDDEILKMLRQRSKDLTSQLREIDNLLTQNK